MPIMLFIQCAVYSLRLTETCYIVCSASWLHFQCKCGDGCVTMMSHFSTCTYVDADAGILSLMEEYIVISVHVQPPLCGLGSAAYFQNILLP